VTRNLRELKTIAMSQGQTDKVATKFFEGERRAREKLDEGGGERIASSVIGV